MEKRILTALLLVLSVLMACSMNKPLTDVRADLQSTIREYNDLVRSHDFDKAKLYTAQDIQEEFEARARAAKDVKVIEYRILSTDFQTTKGEDVVKVEFDYLVSPSTQKKTLTDNQTWSFLYVKELGKKQWRLITLLPDFK